MKALVQRVLEAQVRVDGQTVGSIGRGFLVFLGAGQEDSETECDKLADKISKLRIFEDENGKTNLAISDVGGDILVVSQFTLYADCHHGNRPSFIRACEPERAKELYEYFCRRCEEKTGKPVQRGIFGADMKVSLINDGPFTIMLDCVGGEVLGV